MSPTDEYVLLFTRNGLGDGPTHLQQVLSVKFFTLLLESGQLPARVILYTDGVKLAVEGSPVIEQLQNLANRGVEIVLCMTCLETYGLLDKVRVGIVGGMGDILETLIKAPRVISL